MIRGLIRKLGLVKTALVITFIASSASFVLYLISTSVFGNYNIRGVCNSIIFPCVIAPILSIIFLRITVQLDLSEKALHESKEKYRSIIENIEDGYYEVDADGNFVFFNDSLCRILGYSRADLMGMNHRKLIEKEDVDKVYKTFNHVFTTGEPFKGIDWEIITSDGRKCRIDVSVSLVRDENNNPKGFRGIIRDMTARKQAETALKESNEKYRQLLNHAPTGIYEIDFIKGKLTSVNDVLCEYTGYSRDELLSMSIYDLMTRESQKIFISRLEKLFNGEKIPDSVEYQVKTKDGQLIWALLHAKYFYENGSPKGATVVIHKIDDLKKQQEETRRLEDQLRQAQKMEAIGTLAGGIAHDFNNILSAIMGYTEVSLLRVVGDDKLKQHLQKVLKACNRARDMVKQILAFSRQSDYERKPIRISQVVKEAGKMLQASLPATTDIRMDIDPASGIIDADDIQIHQIMMNLCTNAAYAMKDKGGILGISLSNIELGEKDVAAHPDLKPGSFLKLSISDTGGGISSEVMDRMFDPYFTTKPKGEGTGLGLSIVHGLVKAHSGFLTVESDFGHGSTFHVFLPKTENEFIPEKVESADMPSGSEKILFIDDEQSLADVGKQMLEYLGYCVTIRTSSVEALAHFKSDLKKFDLVITDMTMPELTGDKLSQQILELRPDIPIIICTGHSEHITEKRSREMGIKAFVVKPYLIHDLAKIVRQVMDSHS
ncbi:MAG: PAS domain S-box protein [Desulfobacteraceae bacterium]|nr:PAS domain S-box protein [Desulfobacteraceae bacterium]MBC2755723.1 PAS domain S-box protein [Desulfobacteraceae bacterium]